MSRHLQLATLIFVASAFLLPGEAAYGLVFYLSVMPPLAVAWRSIARPAPGTALALALIAWSGLTLIWGEGNAHRIFEFALGAVATAAFFMALRITLADPRWRRRFATLLICAGAGNAAFSLLTSFQTLLSGERILGWGVTRQPILGGSVMAACYLTTLFRLFEPAESGRKRHLYLGAAALMAVFILAMQSRGALLAATGATLLFFGASSSRWRALAGVLALTAIWLLFAPINLRAHVTRLLLERGTSHRLEIWQTTWALIRQKPLFGHGLAANVPPSTTGFPHNLYLSLLFYSGAVGLLLFGGLATTVTLRLRRMAPGPERAWIAALWLNGLLAGITDLGQITKGPGPLWFILWLPIGLALAVPISPRATASVPRAPATPPPLPGAATAYPPAPRTQRHG